MKVSEFRATIQVMMTVNVTFASFTSNHVICRYAMIVLKVHVGVSSFHVLESSWNMLDGHFQFGTSSSAASELEPWIYVEGGGTGVAVYIDDASVTELATPLSQVEHDRLWSSFRNGSTAP